MFVDVRFVSLTTESGESDTDAALLPALVSLRKFRIEVLRGQGLPGADEATAVR